MESDEFKEIEQQTTELSIEDDDSFLSTEPSFGEVDGEYSEDNNEGIMELKVCSIYYMLYKIK